MSYRYGKKRGNKSFNHTPANQKQPQTKSEPKCINCGEPGSHFVPPSLGEPGFYICERKPAA